MGNPRRRWLPVRAIDSDSGNGAQAEHRIDSFGLLIAGSTSVWLAPDVSVAHGAKQDGSDAIRLTLLGYRELVAAILDRRLSGQAWIRYEREVGSGGGSDGSWSQWECDIELCSDLIGRMTAACLPERGPRDSGGLGLKLRHQVLLDGTRFGELSPELPLRSDYWIVLDFRLSAFSGECHCVISHSVWTGQPRSLLGESAVDVEQVPLDPDLEVHQRQMAQIRDGFAQLISGYLQRQEYRLHGCVRQSADYWIAFPVQGCQNLVAGSREVDARAFWDDANRVSPLAGIGDIRAVAVEVEDISSSPRISLRLLRVQNVTGRSCGGWLSEVATFVAIPYWDGHANGIECEELVDELVSGRTEIEVVAAARLAGILDGLAIWENHVAFYNAVVERGSVLWDALVTHLPVARGLRLARAHRAIELIHQIMLHGVADLGHLRHEVRESRATLQRLSRDINANAGGDFLEVSITGSGSHRSILARTGLLDQTEEVCDAAEVEARRVSDNYAQLIQTIGNAFDERRVRESDSIQRSNFALSVALGAIGLVTVAESVVQLKPDEEASQHTLLTGSLQHWWPSLASSLENHLSSASLGWPTVFAGILLAGVLARTFWCMVRIGRLGGRGFRRRYKGSLLHRQNGVWRFLRLASNDTLEQLAKSLGGRIDDSGRRERAWAEVDQDLSARLAAIWDGSDFADDGKATVRRYCGRWLDLAGDRRKGWPVRMRLKVRRLLLGFGFGEATQRSDVAVLSRRIEQWAVRALLLSERPRHLFHYPLPRLTCLYQVCARIDGSFLSSIEDGNEVWPILSAEFTRSMANCGLTEDDTMRLQRCMDEIVEIHLGRKPASFGELDSRDYGSMRQVLKMLNKCWFDPATGDSRSDCENRPKVLGGRAPAQRRSPRQEANVGATNGDDEPS